MIGNEMLRGVSGGERKRCNLAVEMLGNPSLVFLGAWMHYMEDFLSPLSLSPSPSLSLRIPPPPLSLLPSLLLSSPSLLSLAFYLILLSTLHPPQFAFFPYLDIFNDS